jgi:hypothetical protein
MEVNRNQWFLMGLVLLLLGLQFRTIDSLVLTPELTKFLADHTGHPVAAAQQTMAAFMRAEPVAPKTLRPPEWVGWSLISIGAVLVLHALSMKKPD